VGVGGGGSQVPRVENIVQVVGSITACRRLLPRVAACCHVCCHGSNSARTVAEAGDHDEGEVSTRPEPRPETPVVSVSPGHGHAGHGAHEMG
jgi:hypothetical protein